MKEKSKLLGKAFLVGFIGALLGSVIYVAVHGLFTVVSLFLYLASGVVAATAYATFIKDDERNIGTHFMVDISIVLGVFASQLIDFTVCYSGVVTIPGKENMGAVSKTFYTYFKVPNLDKLSWEGGPVLNTGGGLSVWTLFVLYAITAIIGFYIVMAGLKIGEAHNKKKANKGSKKK